FFVAACGWRLRQLARGGRVRVLVFEDGLARFGGESLWTCRWDEIETVLGVVKAYHLHGAPVGARFVVTVQCGGGKHLRLDEAKEHLTGLRTLYLRIADETSRRLLPRLAADIDAGQTVPFAPLALSAAGIHWGKHVLAWGDTEN